MTSYFQSQWNFGNWYNNVPEYSFKRLRLDKVEILSGGGQKIGEYALGYNKHNSMVNESQPGYSYALYPPRLSNAADHWGYYNGRDYNTGLLPTHLGRYFFSPGGGAGHYEIVNGADRKVDVNCKKVFILDEVVYPAGGVAKYYYDSDSAYYEELNTLTKQYENAYRPAGGLVVKKTVYDPGEGPVIEKRYKYSMGQLAFGSPQHQVWFPSEIRGMRVTVDCYPHPANVSSAIYSTPVNDQVSGMPNRVIHSSVVEEHVGNGKVVYSFNGDAGSWDPSIADLYSEGNPRSIVKPFLNFSQPAEITYYNTSNAIVKKVKNRYKTYYRNVISEGSYHAVTKIQGVCDSWWASNPVYTGFTFLSRSEEEAYEGNKVIKKTTEYAFNHLNYNFDVDGYINMNNNPTLPLHHQPTSMLVSVDQDETIKSEVRYIIDVPSNQRPSAVQQMVDNFLIVRPVEIKTSIIKNGTANVVDAQYLEYKNYGGYFDVSDVYRFNASQPIAENSFSFGIFSSGQFNVNLNTLTKKFQYKFNNNGRMTEQKKTDNTPVSFVYHPYAVNPVFVIVDANSEQVAHTGFEEPEAQDWQTSQLAKYNNASNAAKGWGYAELPASGTFSSPVMPAGTYTISFYAKPKSGGTSSMSINGSNVQVTGAYKKYTVSHTLTSSGRIAFASTSGATVIDEAIIYPAHAQLTEYSYKPVLGMTSQTDANDLNTSFQHDPFGRLEVIKDNDGNILKGYKYKYVSGN